jgi:hypothetical protein
MVDASVERQVLGYGNNPGFWSFMTKGEPHFPRVRPSDPMVAAQYIKPNGLFSKVKCDHAIYKTKDVATMWRVVAEGRRQASS